MREDLVYICEICQTVLNEHHCKAVCPNCGRMLDCSDLPLAYANARVSGDADHHLIPRPGASPLDVLPSMSSAQEPEPPENAPVANLP